MSDIDLKQLCADVSAYERTAWGAAVEASKTPQPIEVRQRVFDHDAHVMAPADPDERAAFLAKRAADRAEAKAKADAEQAEIEAYKKLSPIERAKIDPSIRGAYELVMRTKARPI